MSGITESSAAAAAQAERDLTQKKLFERMEKSIGSEAEESDLEFFFGDLKNEDFTPQKCAGLEGLEDPQTRLAMVRLYARTFHGLSTESVIQGDNSFAIDRLTAAADGFRKLIFSGNISNIVTTWKSMMINASGASMPFVDFYSDASLAENYHLLEFNTQVFDALEKTRHRGAENFFSEEELEDYAEARDHTQSLSALLSSIWTKISEPFYSTANQDMRHSLSELVPDLGLTNEQKNDRIHTANQTIAEMGHYLNSTSGMSFSTIRSHLKDLAHEHPDTPIDDRTVEDYRKTFADLMDFEELSKEEVAKPILITNRENQLERDRIQTMLYDNMEPLHGKTAQANDLKAFYGNAVDADFPENRPNALNALHRSGTRTSLARLYMLANSDVTIDQISSQTTEMMQEKRKWGAEFQDIVMSGDAARIGSAWASMVRYLNKVQAPAIDLTNDETIAANYSTIKLLSSFSTDLVQAIGHPGFSGRQPKAGFEAIVEQIGTILSPEELNQYEAVHQGLSLTLSEGCRIKSEMIFSKHYSGANDGRIGSINIETPADTDMFFVQTAHMSDKIAQSCNQAFKEAA